MRNQNIILYNPAEKTKESLVEDFVLRQRQFEQIFQDIKTSKMEHPEQHYLILGQRGMGKTTLLYRLKYAIEDDAELSKKLIAVSFPEEQYQIGDLAALWEYIGDYLEDYGYSGLLDQMKQVREDEDYEENVFRLIINKLDQNGHKLILLIDNIGELFETFEDESGKQNKRLRYILSSDPHIRLIAASSSVLEHTYRYDKPFYEFFKLVRLEGLSKRDIVILLKHLGYVSDRKEQIEHITKNEPHRIEILRRLTGGVIRSIAILFEIFIDSKDGEIYKDLELILDRVSPLYKARMDDLKPQQKLIVDAVAKSWDALSIKEILENNGSLNRSRIASKQISAQLGQLTQNGIIEKIPTKGKNNLYRIKERFFNIWYLMRLAAKKDKQKVKWLVHFFEEWCSVEELQKIARQHNDKLKNYKYNVFGAYNVALIFIQLDSLDYTIRLQLLSNTLEFLLKENPEQANRLLKEISNNPLLTKAYLKLLQGKHEDILEYSKQTNSNDEITLFLTFIANILSKDTVSANKSLSSLEAILDERPDDKGLEFLVAYAQAGSYYDKGEWETAIKLFKDFLSVAEIKGRVAGIIAEAYEHLEKNIEAEEYYKLAIQEGIHEAHLGLGKLYLKQELYNKAEEELKIALENDINEALRHLIYLGIVNDRAWDIFKWAEVALEKNFNVATVLPIYTLAVNAIGRYLVNEKKVDEAQSFYFNSLSKGREESLIEYIWLIYSNKFVKEQRIGLFKNLLDAGIPPYSQVALLTEIKDFEKGKKSLNQVLSSEEYLKEDKTGLLIDLFTYLAGNKLYHMLYEVFQRPELQLKDKMKPFYYALMHFMQDDYPNEYLRAGEELRETIEEIVAKIKEWHELLK